MNATELMIGDWVCVNGLNAQVFELAYNQTEKELTIGILDPQSEVYYCYEEYDYVEPIPLTKEILNQNFDFHTIPSDGIHSKDEFWLLVEKPKRVWLHQYATSVFVQINTKDECGCECQLLQIKVLHVHELQHALRLCGIEKTIEL